LNPLPEHEVALVEAQPSVEDCPEVIVVGLAVSVSATVVADDVLTDIHRIPGLSGTIVRFGETRGNKI